MNWIVENEPISEGLKEILGHSSNLISQHGQALVGLAGLLFGVWRWWRYREQILHKRLERYLKESDWRLSQCQADLLESIQRPGPGQPFAMPLFANDSLRSVLRERNWDRTPFAASVESSAQWQITKAMEQIDRRLQSGDRAIGSLRNQLASAYIMRGAISSASADRMDSSLDRRKALNAYRAALTIPGHEQVFLAKELEAHELRKLGELEQARMAYQRLEALALSFGDHRTIMLAMAKAKRYRAEVVQALASNVSNGTRTFNASGVAWGLLSPNIANTALSIRAAFAPFHEWDQLEQADIHFLAAFVAHNHNNFHAIEERQLEEARSAYDSVRLDPVRWGNKGAKRRRLLAEKGLDRVARAERGDYDTRWLV